MAEPSVAYITFGVETNTLVGFTKRNGSTLASTGAVLSVQASVRCTGLSAAGVINNPRGTMKFESANGHGSTNTRIARFTTTVENSGTDWATYADSATLGGSVTFLQDGVYALEGAMGSGAGAIIAGASLDSNQLTTSIDSITNTHRLCSGRGDAANLPATFARTFPARAGQVVRIHTDGSTLSTSAYLTWFALTRVSN
jgi:hypothetical protein